MTMTPDRFRDSLLFNQVSRRDVGRMLAAAGLATFSVPLSGNALAESPIQVFTWSGCDGPELHAVFTRACGGSPQFRLYADNDEALATVRDGYRPALAQPTASCWISGSTRACCGRSTVRASSPSIRSSRTAAKSTP